MISARLLYRIAAGFEVLFAAGHTYGFLKFIPTDPQAAAVRKSMDSVRFAMGSQSFSFGGFYVGFGLFVTAGFLLTAWLTWLAGGFTRDAPALAPRLGWPLTIFFVASFALSLSYFALPPTIFSGVILVLLVIATWLAGRGATGGSRQG